MGEMLDREIYELAMQFYDCIERAKERRYFDGTPFEIFPEQCC